MVRMTTLVGGRSRVFLLEEVLIADRIAAVFRLQGKPVLLQKGA